MTKSDWTRPPQAPKRFYETAAVIDGADGLFGVALDGKPIRTPGRSAFAAPRALAEAAAAEWAAQGDRIDPETMPATRAINTTIERIAPHRAAVVAEIAGYAASDLLCHRAEAPESLAAREAAVWDPLLDWAAQALGARLSPSVGVMPAAQKPVALAALTSAVDRETDYGLAPLHELTTLSGSLVIALAVRRGRIDAATGWAASRVDEDWQIAQWGADADAAAAAERRAGAFRDAAAIARLVDPPA